ncbi:hypothetical protein Poli38472_002045 [Pythium oligandrum]|uniref:Uncharacterized protein n=1 Tax=Pythium oligandrum TaxID=41045 RepID=A0A8K1FJG6_PYTOL|nr:hypothetical protein Poli38472_002045 [Pythium oligandrum]|eukprot:TMW63104.1 hypothetical protein Poli38472_002045 [Pythium oligandrum]
MSARRVFLVDLATPPVHRRGVVLYSNGARSAPVHVMGVCVAVERVKSELLHVQIDDGTGCAVIVSTMTEEEKEMLDEIRAGDLLDCFGDFNQAPLHAFGQSWRSYIRASSTTSVEDANAESLRMLESIELYQNTYLRAASSSSGRDELELLRFPHRPHEAINSYGNRKASPIKHPIPVPAVIKNELPQSNGAIPPAEYQLRVSSADLKLMETGHKTLEIRLNTQPYTVIRPNDRIKFNGKLMATVKAVRKYTQLSTALGMEDVRSLIPSITSGSGSAAVPAAIRHLRQFISEEEERQHGVAVFDLDVCVPPVQRTPEEWSQLVYKHLAKAGSTGTKRRDLQFAFPQLPVHQIDGILADLQMDAVVYKVDDTYRLL